MRWRANSPKRRPLSLSWLPLKPISRKLARPWPAIEMPDTATAIVPATSANLGCAFDCAALALNLYLHVRATRNPHRLEIVYQGPRPESIPSGDPNLVVRGIRAVEQGERRGSGGGGEESKQPHSIKNNKNTK